MASFGAQKMKEDGADQGVQSDSVCVAVDKSRVGESGNRLSLYFEKLCVKRGIGGVLEVAIEADVVKDFAVNGDPRPA
jgi:hypothetical protein